MNGYGITTEEARKVLEKFSVSVGELDPIGLAPEIEVRHWVANRTRGAHFTVQNELFDAVNLTRFEVYGYHGGCAVLEG